MIFRITVWYNTGIREGDLSVIDVIRLQKDVEGVGRCIVWLKWDGQTYAVRCLAKEAMTFESFKTAFFDSYLKLLPPMSSKAWEKMVNGATAEGIENIGGLYDVSDRTKIRNLVPRTFPAQMVDQIGRAKMDHEEPSDTNNGQGKLFLTPLLQKRGRGRPKNSTILSWQGSWPMRINLLAQKIGGLRQLASELRMSLLAVRGWANARNAPSPIVVRKIEELEAGFKIDHSAPPQ